MESVEFNCLEMQVERLLRILADLQAENKNLRHQLARNAREKVLWIQHNQQTAMQIRRIISQLQEALV